jgi:hypothetical protein
MNQAERRFATFSCEIRWVGKALSADWMRPERCSSLITAEQGTAMEYLGVPGLYILLEP